MSDWEILQSVSQKSSKIRSRSYPGALNPYNRGALDWGWHNFVAYGCNCAVVTVDPVSLQVVQVYDAHSFPVVKVKWSPDDTFHSLNQPYLLRFASADSNGSIMIWQLGKTRPILTIPGGGRPVVDIMWKPGSPHVLGIIYAPNTLTIVNVKTEAKIWSKEFTEELLFLAFDPFYSDRACVLSVTGVLHTIKDFHFERGKEPEIQRYHVAEDTEGNKRKSTLQKNAKKELFRIQTLISKSNIVSMTYSPTLRNVIYFVMRTEVLIMDLAVMQIVGSIPQEPRSSQFTSVILCRNYPSLLFSVHENGSVVARELKRKDLNDGGLEIGYSLLTQSDSMKFFKGSKFTAVVNNPVTETDLLAVTSDGKILTWAFDSSNSKRGSSLVLNGILENLAPELQTASLSPNKKTLSGPLVKKDPSSFDPPSADIIYASYTCAIGTRDGHVQVFDLEHGTVLRDLFVMEVPIKAIRWVDANSLVCFGYSELSSQHYRNSMKLVNMQTGDVFDFRTDNVENPSYIKDLKISHQRQFMLVIWNEKPLELWDLATNTLTRQMIPYLNITSIEWSPLYVNKRKDVTLTPGTSARTMLFTERFMMSLADGSLVNCTVTGGVICEESKFPHRGGMNTLTAMAWEKKENMLVAGDAGGGLHFYQFKAQKTRTMTTNYGEVKKIKLNYPKSPRRYFIVLFADGVGIWEVDQTEPVEYIPFSSPKEGERDNRVIDIDWVGPDFPLLAMADGSLRVTDLNMRQSTSNFLLYPRSEKLPSPHILNPRALTIFKTLLQHQPWGEKYNLTATKDLFDLDEDMVLLLAQQFDLLPDKFVKGALNVDYVSTEDFKKQTTIPSITAHRCLLTAEYLGDRSEIDFWRVVNYYLNHREDDDEDEGVIDPLLVAGMMTKPRVSSNVSENPSLDTSIELFQNSGWMSTRGEDDIRPTKLRKSNSIMSGTSLLASDLLEQKGNGLPAYFDLLCDQSTVRKRQVELADLYENISSTYDQTQRSVQQHVFLGQHERAIQLLLETPSNTPNFKADALKACLVAALKSPEALKNTIKLVATNFIANNELFEGVQLLSLIGNGLEACTYLQTYGHWNTAAIMAKSTLKKREKEIILRRWADNLQKSGDLEKAILIYVSLRDYHEVLQSFLGYGFYSQAALFLEVCIEQNIPEVASGSFKTMSFTVWKGYSKHLQELGLVKASAYFEDKAQVVQKELQAEHVSQIGEMKSQYDDEK